VEAHVPRVGFIVLLAPGQQLTMVLTGLGTMACAETEARMMARQKKDFIVLVVLYTLEWVLIR